MDWAVLTWGIVVGMVGLLWVMAMAVIQEKGEGKSAERSAEQSQQDPALETPRINNQMRRRRGFAVIVNSRYLF